MKKGMLEFELSADTLLSAVSLLCADTLLSDDTNPETFQAGTKYWLC
jgi:hypothetical protein